MIAYEKMNNSPPERKKKKPNRDRGRAAKETPTGNMFYIPSLSV